MRNFLLLVAGKDRPGIVAAVTQVLYVAGCNLDESNMTRVGSEFAMLAIYSGPEKLTPEAVLKSLERVKREMGLFVEVKPLTPDEARPAKAKGRLALIEVHGTDRPGILYRLSSILAKRRANLTDVTTHRMAESRKAPGCVLFLEAEVPEKVSFNELRKDLAGLGKEARLSLSIKTVRGRER